MDSTYKTNKDGYELFVFILLSNGEGFPASYLFLARKSSEGARKNAIISWYTKLFINTKVGFFKKHWNLS